jgi:phosphoglycolate phosphatase
LYDDRLLVHTVLYDGTREALDILAAAGPLAVLTNKPQAPTERILAGLDIARYFQWVIGGDTAVPRKPDPAGLDSLIHSAGATAADTIMAGDSVIDLRTARAAGTRICLLRYGFGFSTAVAELRGDELIVERASDLATVLRQAA